MSDITVNYQNILYDALEYAYECIVLTDPAGRIIYMNKPYQEFLKIQDVIGLHVTDVIENTRMHIVAQTGKAEIASVQRIQGHDIIANRIPVFRDGCLTAVIGTVMFQDVQQLYALVATVNRLQKEVDFYKGELRRKSKRDVASAYAFEDIIGTSQSLSQAKKLAQRIAKGNTTVLITGESGTGKELMAQGIHTNSQRAMGPFIAVNCAAIPDNLLESELFGYEPGAFTGALSIGKKGKFELADHGTILLDEIGDMPLHLQAKVLRVIQEREIERIGSTRSIPVDVRVISSTHRNLDELIQLGKFREDLFYRLNVFNIHIPPLRERVEDIPFLGRHILKKLSAATGIIVDEIGDDVWPILYQHSWPGNVRELSNVFERAIYMMDARCIQANHISFPIREKPTSLSQTLNLKDTLEQVEKSAILQALSTCGGNKREAAQKLGISKSSLYQKLLQHHIEV